MWLVRMVRRGEVGNINLFEIINIAIYRRDISCVGVEENTGSDEATTTV